MAIKIMRLPADQFRARGYKTTPTPFFLLKTKRNPAGDTRIGSIVGKSVHKTAVKRNFWKRQMLAILGTHTIEGSDILIIATPNIGRLTKQGFKTELSRAIAKAQLK